MIPLLIYKLPGLVLAGVMLCDHTLLRHFFFFSLQNENISHLVRGSKVNSQAALVEIQVVGRDTSLAHRSSNCLSLEQQRPVREPDFQMHHVHHHKVLGTLTGRDQ